MNDQSPKNNGTTTYPSSEQYLLGQREFVEDQLNYILAVKNLMIYQYMANSNVGFTITREMYDQFITEHPNATIEVDRQPDRQTIRLIGL